MEACRLLSEMLRAHSWPGTQVSRLVVEAVLTLLLSRFSDFEGQTISGFPLGPGLWAVERRFLERLFGNRWGRGKATAMRWHFLPKVLLGVTFLGWTTLVPVTTAPHFHHLR